MMDGEEVYRARVAACLEAAAAERLPQMKARHLSAAQSWQVLLDLAIAAKHAASAAKTPGAEASNSQE